MGCSTDMGRCHCHEAGVEVFVMAKNGRGHARVWMRNGGDGGVIVEKGIRQR